MLEYTVHLVSNQINTTLFELIIAIIPKVNTINLSTYSFCLIYSMIGNKLSKLPLKGFNKMLAITPCSNRYSFTKSNHPHFLCKPKFSFSTTFQQPSKPVYLQDPQIFHMNKHIQQLRKQQPTTSDQLTQLLHQFALLLSSKKHNEQAIIANQQAITRLDMKLKKTQKTSIEEQIERVLYYKLQKELYQAGGYKDKVVECSLTLIKHAESIVNQNSDNQMAVDFVVNQCLELAQLLYQNKQTKQTLELLSKINYLAEQKQIEKHLPQTYYHKVLKARNLLAIITNNNHLQGKDKLNANNQKMNPQDILEVNLNKILQLPSEKIPLQILAECIFNLTHLYLQQINVLDKVTVKEYLSKIQPWIKKISEHYTKMKNNKGVESLLVFYREVATINFQLKDLPKAIQYFKLQRQLINANQLQLLADNNLNQGKAYLGMRKLQKAIQKMTKSFQIRQKNIQQLVQKRKNSPQQQQTLSVNKKLITETALTISQLYKRANNSTKSEQWRVIYNSLAN